MPIKFACPECKTSITVDEKMAGKSGKCKCGATITIPKPKTPSPKTPAGNAKAPAAEPPNPAMGAVFDDLTEADYNRQSPFQNVYAPPRTKQVKIGDLPGQGEHKKPAKAAKKRRVLGMWQFGLLIILSSIVTNVVMMQIQGPMEDTAASRGQALGRGVATLIGIVVGIVLVIVGVVRRKK